jgi:hypothetical protein
VRGRSACFLAHQFFHPPDALRRTRAKRGQIAQNPDTIRAAKRFEVSQRRLERRQIAVNVGKNC